jgi:hypothetical protein
MRCRVALSAEQLALCRDAGPPNLTRSFHQMCRMAQMGRSVRAMVTPRATTVVATQPGDEAMTTTDQPSTRTQASLDQSMKTGESIGTEVTADELNHVAGGAFDTYMQFMDTTNTYMQVTSETQEKQPPR